MKQFQKTTPVDRIYKLKKTAPLSFTLPSRNTKRFPLLWFDETNNINRPLRYAVNQKSPFEDEQDGNAILEPIIFDNGLLRVPKENPILQEFLYYHPLRGKTFEEIDTEKDAQKVVEDFNAELDAMNEARSMPIEQLEVVYRVLFQKDPSMFKTAEIKRDVLVFAKRDPKAFTNLLGDPMLKLQSSVHIFFEKKLLVFRNNKREVWYNTTSNKKKMLMIPYGEDPYAFTANFLRSDEGIDSLKMLENMLENQ
ncbi:MAG: hypothetical protein [Podoviridae sp. ctrTa16]|nr:MAG: hypothetical protein [Podoviridae sp. ctrTa16]